MGQDQEDPTHSANFGIGLQQRCRELGIRCEVVYPGAENIKHPTAASYLIAKLKAPAGD